MRMHNYRKQQDVESSHIESRMPVNDRSFKTQYAWIKTRTLTNRLTYGLAPGAVTLTKLKRSCVAGQVTFITRFINREHIVFFVSARVLYLHPASCLIFLLSSKHVL